MRKPYGRYFRYNDRKPAGFNFTNLENSAFVVIGFLQMFIFISYLLLEKKK